MKNSTRFAIVAAVLLAMGSIFIYQQNKVSNDVHDHSVSQINILNEALDEDLPILIDFVTHS